jgi:hypothetical protein
MKELTKYEKQVKEIRELTAFINAKSKAFAIRNKQNQNFDDLMDIIEELRDINKFIN